MAVVYTQAGEELVVDLIDDTASGSATHYVSAGTGAGSFGKGSTTLFTEVSEARASATKSQPAVDKNQWQGTQAYTGAKTITNAGVFNATSGGTLILAVDGLSITVANGDSIQFTFTLEQT